MHVLLFQGATRELSYARHPSKVGDTNEVLCFIVVYCCPFNKLTSVFCVCPVIDHEFRHNIVKVAVDPQCYDEIHRH